MTLNEAADLMNAMEDAAGIAFLLDMHGIKGMRRGCFTCPIACLLFELTGTQVAQVTRSFMHTDHGWRASPTNVVSFTTQFDAGEWPELEA